MNLQVENLEKNTAKLTIEVPAEQFAEAVQKAYKKEKGKFNVPGFRKGKAPFNVIKKLYGEAVFYNDAADIVINDTYEDAMKESKLDIVSRPNITFHEIEEGKAVVYEAVVAVKPEVTLGEYKGVEVQKAKAEVTDEDVDAEIKSQREKNSRLVAVTDRAIENGDQVTVDFDGYVDGERFDGGKGENYPLVIGSHTFIDTFEDQLVGKNAGDECEVNVTFPADYHVDSLKNKPAVFKVKIHDVQTRELPELNDEFASEVSDFETLEEYKNDLKTKLLDEKQRAAATENENNVVKKVVENAKMEIADQMLNDEAARMLEDWARRMESQGLKFNDYLKYTGMTAEAIMDQMKPEALKRIQTRLVLEAVVKAENITTSDETFEAEIKKMAESYKMDVEKLKGLLGENTEKQMREDLAVQEAIDFLVAEAKLVD